MQRIQWLTGFIAGLLGGLYIALLVRASSSDEPLELEIGIRSKESLA